jgi:hypothetical protein
MLDELAEHREELCSGHGEWRDFLVDIHVLHDLAYYCKQRMN